MSKYKVGDKVVIEIAEVIGDDEYRISEFIETEPLSTYTEPLEAKIRRQAAEITRLLRENNELKEQIIFDLPTLISEEDRRRMDINKARAEGQKEAWELARKIVFNKESGYSGNELFEIFNTAIMSEILKLTYLEAAAKVAQWEKAKAKPQKTILMDLLEKHPNIETEVDGLPKFCPFILGYKVLCSSKKTCKECWNRPLEQIGEE